MTAKRAAAIHAAARRLLPAVFRAEHGDAMAAVFEEAAARAWAAGGGRAVQRLLLGELGDLVRAAVRLRLPRRTRTGRKRAMTGWVDVRQGIRQWRRRPGFAAVAVTTLGLGVGAATSIWTVADGVLFRPLPHEDPDALVWVAGTSRELSGARLPLSWPNFVDLRADGSTGFADMAAYEWPGPRTVVFAEEPQSLNGVTVTVNTFALLGNRAAVGRTFIEADGEPDAPLVVLLSDAVWRRDLGADPAVLGRRIRINDNEYEIVGVMPPRFDFPWPTVDMWLPLRATNALQDRDTNYLSVIGRLARGVTLEEARRRAGAAMDRLVQAFPDDNAGKGAVLTPRHEAVVAHAVPAMRVLLGASLLLLLLACANLANLMLARGAVRRRELAVRSALGAGRGRLVVQLMAETAVLVVAGGLLGVALAYFLVDLLVSLAPASIPRLGEIVLDGRALGFAAAASVLSGLAFGLVPALGAAAAAPAESLREAGRGSGQGARRRGLRGLVVAQLALALVLVSGGGLLAHSFSRLAGVDPGFDATGVYTFRLNPPTANYPDLPSLLAFYDAVERDLAALPAVEAVGATWALPFTQDYASGRVTIEGRPLPEGSEPNIALIPVRGDYLEAMDLTLRSGRWFEAADVDGAPPVVVINEAAARRFWPGEDAVGRRLRRGRASETDLPWITVIGVVEDAKRRNLTAEVEPEMYWNHPQAGGWARAMTFVVRTTAEPTALAAPVRAVVARHDARLAVTAAMPLSDHIARSIAEPRFRTLLLASFSMLALLLAVIGTYGVMAFAVMQRRHEIGVRMALGADRGRVVRGVLLDGARLIAAAVVLGLLGSLAASRALTGLLFGIQPLDPLAHGAAVAALVGSALLACWLPARRASRFDPLDTLRD